MTGPDAFIHTLRPTLRGKAEPGSKVTVWLGGIMEKENILTDGGGGRASP